MKGNHKAKPHELFDDVDGDVIERERGGFIPSDWNVDGVTELDVLFVRPGEKGGERQRPNHSFGRRALHFDAIAAGACGVRVGDGTGLTIKHRRIRQ